MKNLINKLFRLTFVLAVEFPILDGRPLTGRDSASSDQKTMLLTSYVFGARHRMNVTMHRLFYFLAVLVITACATVPITGRTQLMLIGDDRVRTASSLAFADFMRGAEQKRAVLSRSESPEAARILDQVNRVTNRILEASGLKDQYNWEVVVVKSNVRNAYVLSNGKIVCPADWPRGCGSPRTGSAPCRWRAGPSCPRCAPPCSRRSRSAPRRR